MDVEEINDRMEWRGKELEERDMETRGERVMEDGGWE